jgi:DNA polymerase
MSLHDPVRPAPGALQKRWLAELGVDRYFLEHLCADDTFVDAPAAAEPSSRQSARPSSVSPVRVPGISATPAAGQASTHVARGDAATPAPGPDTRSQDAQQSAVERVVKADTLLALQEHARTCTACSLHAGRGSVVFGSGQSQGPQWMLVSEAPTTDDDRAGLPFQGRAGILLRAMLAAAGIDLDTQVYTTQLVKCQPLGNRPPSSDEIGACSAYLRRQIALIQPERLVALGQLAARALYVGPESPEHVQGLTLQYRCESGRQIPLLLTHNPTALLTRPQHKLQVWRDLMFMRGLDQRHA